MKNMKVNILGTEYSIETHKVSEDEYMQKNRLAGYCGEEDKRIIIADMSEEEYFTGMDEKSQKKYWRKVCRHEIIHAFFNESGLSDSSNHYDGAWAKMKKWLTGSQFSHRKFLRYVRALIFWENNNGHRNNETTDKKIRTRS